MSKTLKHEIKADALIEKGMMLLWSKGYNATSVNDIVKEAGVPKGSFYFYFDSKEDFAVKSIEKYFDMQFPPALEILQNKSVSPRQRVIDFYEFHSKVLKEEFDCKMGCMGCNLANEMAEHNEAIRNAINTKTEMIKAHITQVIKEAQKLGEVDSNIEASDLVAFMEDAGKGAMITMKAMNSAYPIDNFTKMVRMILLK
ncbi:TetR/AcrR family transcriptional regulator [Aquimarina sp. 2304DJ70-9]|uniref:TetR/AcrR family transcriptional regulator n=1 Tax=Aquimarina penaris TaxID=3231044 RepID=UPI003462E7B1